MQGDDDLKQHEDKESDTEEVNSPTSQDHPNSQHDLSDGEKVDDRSHTPSSSEDGQSVDGSKVHPEAGQIAVEEGGVDVDRYLKLADQSNDKTENVEIVSSNELKGDNLTAVLVEPMKESSNVYLEKTAAAESHVINKAAVSDEAVNALSGCLPAATEAILIGGKSIVIEENGSVVEVDKVEFPHEKDNGYSTGSAASVTIPDVTVPGTAENGEKEAILLDRNDLQNASANLVSENKTDEVVAKMDDIVTPSDAKVPELQITEGNLIIPNNAPRAVARNGLDSVDNAEQKNDIEVSESSDSQPLLAASHQPRSSWMNCCGLFGVFTGSKR